MSRQAINARGAATVGPYSHAVQAGDLIFLSGQTRVHGDTAEHLAVADSEMGCLNQPLSLPPECAGRLLA